jgi:hypothetical protein
MTDWLQPFTEGLTIGFTLLVMLIGLFGLVIPIFPGGVVIWLAALAYGIVNGFSTVGNVLFVLITLLMIASALADNILMGERALNAGASWWSLFFGAIGGILGTIFFPPIGGLIGAPLSVYAYEYYRFRDAEKAMRVTRGLLIGWGWAFVARFSLGVLKIFLWGIWVWTNTSA